MNLLQHLDRYPPYVIRLVARTGGNGRVGLTNRKIAEISGLNHKTINQLSRRKTWAGVSVGTASRFCEACGVDIIHTRRLKEYLLRGRFSHLSGNKKYFLGIARQ